MLYSLAPTKDQVLFFIAIAGFLLSLYNFFHDSRRIKLIYTLIPDKNSNRLMFFGILSNPSKTPNSVVSYSYFLNDKRVKTSTYHDKGFDMGTFHKNSIFSPLELAANLPVGGTIPFQDVLKIESLSSADTLILEIKTANYSKKFNLKLRESF